VIDFTYVLAARSAGALTYTHCMHVALANLLSEIIMVRDGRYIQCLSLGLVLSCTDFIVLTRVRFYNK